MENKNIYQKLAQAKFDLSLIDFKKSGYNDHLKFHYHELKDFLPHITKVCNEIGLVTKFDITEEFNEASALFREVATLVLTDIDSKDSLTYNIPTADVKNSNPIQGLGGKITYCRRYLNQITFDISEADSIENQPKSKDEVKPQLANDTQIKKIMEIVGDDIELGQKVLGKYKKTTYKEFTLNEASECIKLLQQAK